MLIFLFVGSVFFLVASILTYKNLYFSSNGRKLSAKVHAIEKYLSRTRKGSSTFYHPILEYSFNGENVLFCSSIGSGTPTWEIGEKIDVYSLDKGPEYVKIANRNQWVFPSIFGLVGLGLMIFFILQEQSLTFLLFSVLSDIGIFFLLYLYIKKKSPLDKVFDSLLTSKIETSETLKDRDIYFEKKVFDKEMSKYEGVTIIVTSVITSACYFAMAYFWNISKKGSQEYFWKVVSSFTDFKDFQNYTNDKAFLGFLIMLFFSLTLSYSLAYQLKNRRKK